MFAVFFIRNGSWVRGLTSANMSDCVRERHYLVKSMGFPASEVAILRKV
jgi:hypothetical protein